MNKYYDVHNHLFNKHFLAKELLYRMIKELKKYLTIQKERSLDRGPDRGLKNVITSLKRFKKALKVFTQKNSIAIYEHLDKTYKGEFILTPLTFDLTYCFAASADRSLPADSQAVAKEAFVSEMDAMFEMIEQQTRELSRSFNPFTGNEEDELWKEYIAEKELFMREAEEFQKSEQTTEAATRGIRLPGATSGWDEQLRQIAELKKHPVYKDMVFPFLAIDPRRPGIADYAKENVGKGKMFAGVKLYCPTGYSPTDPLLFGPDGERGGIYAFCEDNGIPVTTHNSDGGFATLAKNVYINGLIQVNGKLHRLKNELLKFSKAIHEKDAVYERALTLNHPLIWEKVAEKYPNLLLNLAHFGGGRQLEAALDNPMNINLWSNKIIDLMKNNQYKVYTDVSCFSEFHIIDKLIASAVYQEIKKKILYGSDYTLLLLFEDDFDENVRLFRTKFGSDFDIIARENPEEFLKNVI
ncbi:MAG TPA: amidohydrolase family protein [Draconibacterium sp.]|jgi:predicted TIM-barrel fold metal-dependent hydrolase|nr:amidohydrolase family protein [Draconibacterium sp.]